MPYDQHDNPYINPLANKPYEMGPARKYYKDWIRGNFQNMPEMAQFGQALNQRYQDIDNQSDPLSMLGAGEAGGALGNRVQQLQRDRAAQGIFGQRFGYIGQKTGEAAQGLERMWQNKNAQESQNLATAGSLENGRYNYYQKQNPWAQFAGAALGSFL